MGLCWLVEQTLKGRRQNSQTRATAARIILHMMLKTRLPNK